MVYSGRGEAGIAGRTTGIRGTILRVPYSDNVMSPGSGLVEDHAIELRRDDEKIPAAVVASRRCTVMFVNCHRFQREQHLRCAVFTFSSK